ncbi:MAG: SDR family oxidoreductase, partial [Thermodesulfobacteriota bacterium]
IVTGGAKRLGREIALSLAALGYSIALHYSTTKPDGVAQEIRASGVECEPFQCDFSGVTEVEGFVEKVLGRFPSLELLINNASVFERSTIEETSLEFLERHLTINFTVPFILSRDFKRHVGKGHIINITDTNVTKNFSTYAAYLLSKKALSEFTRMAAREFAPETRVNAVAPGLILPPDGEGEEYTKRLSERIPLKRAGEPADIASAIEFLVNNDFVTGEILFIDGGRHL